MTRCKRNLLQSCVPNVFEFLMNEKFHEKVISVDRVINNVRHDQLCKKRVSKIVYAISGGLKKRIAKKKQQTACNIIGRQNHFHVGI